MMKNKELLYKIRTVLINDWDTVRDAVYTASPPTGTPIRVNSITQPLYGQPGGLPEVNFILGTPPGSVSPPVPIKK